MFKAFAFGLVLLAGTTGCSALMNPKAAWAVGESTPMSVIVRRAEVARETADDVDRLLTQTKIDAKSKWTPKTALSKDDATDLLNSAAAEPVYFMANGQKLRVVSAEAWAARLDDVCSQESKYPSLLASLSPEVAKKFGELEEKQRDVADMKSSIAKEDAAIDEKGATDATKEEHRKAKKELEDKVSKAEDEIAPIKKELLATLKDEAAKAPADVHDRVAVAVINMQRAVADAKMANTAAILRYPMSLPQLTTDVQETAKRIIADIIEEKTGKRPDMNGLKPEVKLDGTDVKLELNGIPADKLAGLSPGDIIEETTKRMKKYAERVVTLLAYAASTDDQLSFEADVLSAISDGMKLNPGSEKDAGVAIDDLKIESGPGAKKKDAKAPTGPRSPVGLTKKSCAGSAVDEAVASKDSDKSDKSEKETKKEAKAKKPAASPAKQASAEKASSKATIPARYSPVQDAPKASPAPAPSTGNTSSKDCEIQVESAGGKHVCL